MDKDKAQLRTDQIHAFRAELTELAGEGALVLLADVRRQLDAHHTALLRKLAAEYDVDTSKEQQQLSWGMRIASFLGSLALAAAVFFFFYRFWGALGTAAQVGILIAAPLLATFGVEFVARRERSLYFASLLALVALACFVLNLSMLGQIFTITPTQNAFLAWGLFGLILAYRYGLRLVLVAALTCLLGYLSATVGTWEGVYWLSFGERPENFLLGGIALLAVGLIGWGQLSGFNAIYRVYGLLVLFITLLILSHWGAVSYLPLSNDVIQKSYQTLGFVIAGLTIWLGIRRHWSGVANLGSTFFVIFLYTKFFDWWWNWMPKYVFFLVIGLIAVLLLLVLQRLRTGDTRALA